jgi:GNAT superfamily N-acetyltransferase
MMTASDVRIVPVSTEQQRREFVKFPWRLYEDDPLWVPPIYMDQLALLNSEKHPFYEHGEVQFFLAKRGQEVVGTTSAHINHIHNKTFQDKVGFFGFFDTVENSAVAEVLLNAASEWLRERGMEAIRGPESFSQNEECGLLVDGFDSPPVVLMAYNPRYYQTFIEQAGFEKAQDLWAWDIRTSIFELDVERLPRKFLRVAEQARQRENVLIRPIDMKRFDEDVELAKEVYNAAWEQNWGFTPMTDHEMEHLAAEVKMILDPDLIQIVLVDGEPAGMALGLPDVNQALIKARPQPNMWSLPLTLGKFLWHRRNVSSLRLWAMGVVPEYRTMGLEALLMVETARAAFGKGYKRCEMSWILESNDMMNRIIERLGGNLYKTYRIYQKPL